METNTTQTQQEKLLAQLRSASQQMSDMAEQLEQNLAVARAAPSSEGDADVTAFPHIRQHPALGIDCPPHHKRVVEERRELDDRIEKLDAFLESATFAQLDDSEQGRMHAQRAAMADYSRVLGERIAAFTVPAEV